MSGKSKYPKANEDIGIMRSVVVAIRCLEGRPVSVKLREKAIVKLEGWLLGIRSNAALRARDYYAAKKAKAAESGQEAKLEGNDAD